MTDSPNIKDISTGSLTSQQAADLILRMIGTASDPGKYYLKDLEQIYRALLAWTWRALNERRRDPDLQRWYELTRKVTAAVQPRYPQYAARLKVLTDLLGESVLVTQHYDPFVIVEQAIVKDAIRILMDHQNDYCRPSVFAMRLSLSDTALTALLNQMSDAGICERGRGGEADRVRLTVLGLDIATKSLGLFAYPLIARASASSRGRNSSHPMPEP